MRDLKNLYTVKRIAELAGTTPGNVRAHICRHDLDAAEAVGPVKFYDAGDLAFIKSRIGKVGQPGHKKD